jgi:hypothetical protein
VQHKKKSKKKRPARPSLLAPEEQAHITSLLQDFRNTDPAEIVAHVPDSRHAQFLIEILPLEHEDSIPLLVALKGVFNDKHVGKAVKRAVFKLKKRGIPTEAFYEEKSPAPTILKPVQKDSPAAYLGPLDSGGFRAIMISLPRSMKGADVGVGIVSDEQGIQQFLFTNFSKKRAKEMKDYLLQEVGLLVETSLSHAATILEDAYRRHQEHHSEAPQDYLELRPWLLENVSLLECPVIYNFMSEPSVSEGILTKSRVEKLFRHELARSWLIEFEPIKPFVEDIIKVDASPIVLTEAQKSTRITQIKAKALEVLFPVGKRELLMRRFEELAYIFFKLDEEEYAKLSLAAARIMGEQCTVLRTNPVIEFLLDRSLDFYMDASKDRVDDEDQRADSSPSIILP